MEIQLLKLWVDDKIKKIETGFDGVNDLKEINQTRGKLDILEELYDFFNLSEVSMEEIIFHNQI